MEIGAIGNANYSSDPHEEAKNAAAAAQKAKEAQESAAKKKKDDEFNALPEDVRASIIASSSHAMGEAIAMSVLSGIVG